MESSGFVSGKHMKNTLNFIRLSITHESAEGCVLWVIIFLSA